MVFLCFIIIVILFLLQTKKNALNKCIKIYVLLDSEAISSAEKTKMTLICTHCEQTRPCKIIGDMFVTSESLPRVATVCSFFCLLNCRLRSIQVSRLLLQELQPYIKDKMLLRQVGKIIENSKFWPTRTNEIRCRRLATKVIKQTSIYDKNLSLTSVSLLSTILEQ